MGPKQSGSRFRPAANQLGEGCKVRLADELLDDLAPRLLTRKVVSQSSPQACIGAGVVDGDLERQPTGFSA
jgi:hypothetical protein